MKTVISNAPNTRPKCQTSRPLLTASLGKNGACNERVYKTMFLAATAALEVQMLVCLSVCVSVCLSVTLATTVLKLKTLKFLVLKDF